MLYGKYHHGTFGGIAFVPRVVLFVCLHLPQLAWTQSIISFCDGDNPFVITEADCHGGIYFGERKPTCVCISGVYRSWTKDCKLYDGFTHEYCSTFWGESELQILGVRLLSGIHNMLLDTIVVFEEEPSKKVDQHHQKTWTKFGMNTHGKTRANNFYALNGFSVMLTKANDRFICVEPAVRQEKQVCRYFANDNLQLWEPGQLIRILVQENCTTEDYKMVRLKEYGCYDLMNSNFSDCKLDCENGKLTYPPGSLPLREKKSVKSNGLEIGISTKDDLPGPPPTNANFFIHRKFNKYIQLRQTGQLAIPDLSQVTPNRTFFLLETAKGIVREFCPQEFISNTFFNSAIELFVLLHQGQDFRYIEDVSYPDFRSIQDILMSCKVTVQRTKEFHRWHSNKGRSDNECRNHDLLGEFVFIVEDIFILKKLTRGAAHHSGKYHFVAEVIWKIIDLVHVLCYPDFARKSYRMFHMWEQASEKLFTRDIRKLWHNPQIEVDVYNSLLSNRAVIDMVNLERCTQAAYAKYPSLPELVRPDIQKSTFIRKKRELLEMDHLSIAKTVDVYCTKEKDLKHQC